MFYFLFYSFAVIFLWSSSLTLNFYFDAVLKFPLCLSHSLSLSLSLSFCNCYFSLIYFSCTWFLLLLFLSLLLFFPFYHSYSCFLTFPFSTDKTGTLTQNLMSVANTWFMGKKHDIKSFSAQNEEVPRQVSLLPLPTAYYTILYSVVPYYIILQFIM